MGEESKNSGGSVIGAVLTVGSLAAGGYHGYCDAQGIPFEKENLECFLKYGPTIVYGAFGAATGGLLGIIGGGIIGTASGLDSFDSTTAKTIAKGAAGATIGTVVGAGLGGVLGAAKGAICTLIGYGAGYFVGYALK